MLSRPSFSIRRLISPRRTDHPGDDGGLQRTYDAQDSTRDSTDGLRNKTWPKGNRKGPIPTIDIRRSEDIHRILVLPPLPDTPKSWTGSISTCEDDGKSFTSPRSSPTPPTEKQFPGSPNRTPQRSPQRSPLLTPKQAEFSQRIRSRSLGPSSPTPFLPHSPPSSPESQPCEDAESPICPMDIADAYFSAPRTKKTQRAAEGQSTGRVGRSRSRGYSDDVQRLIRETDEAFKLRHSFSAPRIPSPETPRGPTAANGAASARSAPLVRRTSQRSVRSSTRSTKAPTKSSLKIPLIATPAAFASISKTKKKQVKRFSRRPRGGAAIPISRWTLTESARDLFNIRIFNKIEADEMLPESVLREIRMSRATQARLAKHTETEGIDIDESPTQPNAMFINESPPPIWPKWEDEAREPAAVMVRPHSSASDRGETPKDGAPTDEGQQESPVDVVAAYMDEEETFPAVTAGDDQQTPSAKVNSTKNTHRRPPKKRVPLPTIPEIIASGAENTFLSPTSRRRGTNPIPRLNTDDYTYLPATPFTLTAPVFRHGPIRLAKPIGQLAAAVDDTLDWTAFQMAILGGAGDFFGEATDYSRPSDAELDEREGMAAWFAEFGFEGSGALVPAAEALRLYRVEAAAASPATPSTPVDIPGSTPLPPSVVITAAESTTFPPRRSSLVTRVDPPPLPFPGNYMISANGIGAGQEGVGGWLQFPPPPQYQSRRSYVAPNSRPRSLGGVPMLDGLGIDNPLKERRVSTESEISLPQSPMLDLVVSRDSGGNEYVVPMGFNLGHDLGDFLRWEAEHVFGGGYYDPDQV